MQQWFAEHVTEFSSNPFEALRRLFADTATQLEAEYEVEANASGSTALVAYFDFDYLYVASVGDSRCILATEMEPEVLKDPKLSRVEQRGRKLVEGLQLSTDHKPGVEAEKARIEDCGGSVTPVQNEFGDFCGPDRIWKAG
jgi:serine/threonine protein phosphatase PrpC